MLDENLDTLLEYNHSKLMLTTLPNASDGSDSIVISQCARGIGALARHG